MTRALLLLAVAPVTLRAQVAGDSVRFRPPHAEWQFGRIVSAGDSLMVQQGSDRERVGVAGLQRLDRWQRKNAGEEMALMIAACAAGGLVAYVVTPANQRSLSAGTMLALGAGFGVVIGGISLAVHPGRWEILINR